EFQFDRWSVSVNRRQQVSALVDQGVSRCVGRFILERPSRAALGETITAHDQTDAPAIPFGNLLGKKPRLVALLTQPIDLRLLLFDQLLLLIAPGSCELLFFPEQISHMSAAMQRDCKISGAPQKNCRS